MSQRSWAVRPSVLEDLPSIRELFLQVYKYVLPLVHDIWKFLTDLCLGLKEVHLLDAFAQHIREKYHAKPGFVTYNLVSFVELFRKAGMIMKDVVIMTPFNSIGYQMSPSRQSCETCLSFLYQGDVIAMSIMAGGFLKVQEAINYVRSLPNFSGVAVGVSSKEHAHNTFTRLRAMTEAPDQIHQTQEQANSRTDND
ncbi:MAG: hypothetical protein ABSD41_07230 [Candidatus Bathyarchaeia archaeon]